MLIGLYKTPGGTIGRGLKEKEKRYREILEINGIDYLILDANDFDFWDKVRKLDLFIFHWAHIDDHHQIAKTIIPIIEKEIGVKCYPDLSTCWHYDDKIREYYLLKTAGFPIVETYIFWDKIAALKWLETATLPTVFKLKGGAGSSNVILVHSKEQGRYLINKIFKKGIYSGKIPDFENLRFKEFTFYSLFRKIGGDLFRWLKNEVNPTSWQVQKNYVIFQKYLKNNDYDTRVTVIGNRAFAFRRFNRNNDFRASGSDIVDMDIKKIDKQLIKIAFDISFKLGFQSMAYDFIYDENRKPALIEISYTFPSKRAFTTGYWDINLKWNSGSFYPEYFILSDAIGCDSLKKSL